MGNRQSRKKNDEQDGKVSGRSGSKRGSGRKKKNEAEDGSKAVDGTGKKKTVNGNKKADGKVEETKANGKEIRRAFDDSELNKRPKMGRLSASFAAGETRSARKENFSAIDDKRVDGAGPKTAELKIYRSFSSLADEKKVTMYDAQPSLANVKIYRKAPETPLNPSQRAMSLPRGFGRTRNMLNEQGNGTLGRRRAGSGRDTVDQTIWENSKLDNNRYSTPAVRSATLPRLHHSASVSSTPSSATGYRVTKNDFPDSPAIQRKLKQFESFLVRCVLAKYSTRLSPEAQLTSLPVVIRPGRPNQLLTLHDYLEFPEAIPDDVVDRSASGDFILCVPTAMFAGMAHFRRERYADRDHWPMLSRDLVTCVVAEAAAEISRMFEYQIALLTGETTINLLAEHCAERIFSFILHDLPAPRLDRNTAILGALRGKRVSLAQNPAYISVIIGFKELKWNLFEIFDKPGLRKDVLLVHDNVPAPGDDDRCPWKYYTSFSSDPMLYGYRGQLLEWDFTQGHFRVNSYDEATFNEEMSWRYDDFHRLYPPYRRLFGARAMKRYYTEQPRTVHGLPLPLDRFLMQTVHGPAYTRDVIQPIYRPLEPFTLAEVDGVDLTGADVPRALMPRKNEYYENRTPLLSPSGEPPVFISRTPQPPLAPSNELQVYQPTQVVRTSYYSPGPASLNASFTSEPRWSGYTLVEEVTTIHSHKASNV